MVEAGGTGRPRFDIWARFAPLPPRRSRMPASPSALPSPKVYTHFAMVLFPLSGLPRRRRPRLGPNPTKTQPNRHGSPRSDADGERALEHRRIDVAARAADDRGAPGGVDRLREHGRERRGATRLDHELQGAEGRRHGDERLVVAGAQALRAELPQGREG